MWHRRKLDQRRRLDQRRQNESSAARGSRVERLITRVLTSIALASMPPWQSVRDQANNVMNTKTTHAFLHFAFQAASLFGLAGFHWALMSLVSQPSKMKHTMGPHHCLQRQRNRTEVFLLTNLTLYRSAKTAHQEVTIIIQEQKNKKQKKSLQSAKSCP